VLDVFAIDDSAQAAPSRPGMGPLVAVGGIHISGEKVRDLELALDALCAETGFPAGEEFKWSPKTPWMRKSLIAEARQQFFLAALKLARGVGATAIVAMEDTRKAKASSAWSTHEDDVTMMFLERAHAQVPAGRAALVLFDRQGGDHRDDFAFLSSCIDKLRTGTAYTKLDKLALALSSDSRLSRLLQLADMITGCSTSFVAGESRWSPRVFTDGVLPLLRQDYGRKGGCGLKIHPDWRYGNLYHWLLGDTHFVRYQMGEPLPSTHFTCYRLSGDSV
jgi:hypothetical protein